ncbi:MAG: hypothetical protein V9G08_14285 [Dermatophilaceae bacterium]
MFGMPLEKLVSGLGRPDRTPRTVFVTVHDPDDPVGDVQPPTEDGLNVRALLAGGIGRVAGVAGRRARVLRRRLRVRRLARSA